MAATFSIKIAISAFVLLSATTCGQAFAQAPSKFANATRTFVPASPARIYTGAAQINRARRSASADAAGPQPLPGQTISQCTIHSCPTTEFSGRDPARLVPVESPQVVLYASQPATIAHDPAKHRFTKSVAHRPVPHSSRRSVAKPIAHHTVARSSGTSLAHKIAHASVHGAPKLRKQDPILAQVAFQQAVDCNDLQRRAQSLIDAGEVDKADALLKDAIEHNPSEPCPRKVASHLSVCRARKMLACDQLECAARQLREALFILPEDDSAASLLNETIKRSGLDPTDPSIRSGLGQRLLHSGRAPAALVEFRQSLALKNTASAQIGLAQAASKLNLRTIALSALKQAVSLEPNNYPASRDLGFLQEAAGNLPGAIAAFTHAVALNPQDVASGQELLSLAQSAVSAQPSAGNYVALARAYLLNGVENKAAETFQKIGGKTPAGISYPDWLQAERNYQAQLAAAGQEHEAGVAMANDPVAKFMNEGPLPSVNGSEIAATPSCNCH